MAMFLDIFVSELHEFAAFQRLLREGTSVGRLGLTKDSAPRFVTRDMTERRNCRLFDGHARDGIDESR